MTGFAKGFDHLRDARLRRLIPIEGDGDRGNPAATIGNLTNDLSIDLDEDR